MRIFETAGSGERFILMAGSGNWVDRLPHWLSAPEAQRPSGSSMGPRERLIVAVALLGIAIWGFNGSWEYPTIETAQPTRAARTPILSDPKRDAVPDPAALAGAQLFEANGCYACHSVEGERKIGPGLLGIFGQIVELDDGNTVLIDEAYLVESILQPGAKRVAGYEDAEMPSYEGLVSAEDASVLAEYIKSLE